MTWFKNLSTTKKILVGFVALVILGAIINGGEAPKDSLTASSVEQGIQPNKDVVKKFRKSKDWLGFVGGKSILMTVEYRKDYDIIIGTPNNPNNMYLQGTYSFESDTNGTTKVIFKHRKGGMLIGTILEDGRLKITNENGDHLYTLENDK